MTDPRISAHDAELVRKAIDRLAPRWTTWTLQTIAQHGQMRVSKGAAALPWLTTPNAHNILRRMHTDGLLDRPVFGVYEVSPSGRHAHSIHRTLASWHRTHSGGGGPTVAEAERTEDTLRRLRGEGAVPVRRCAAQSHDTGSGQHGQGQRSRTANPPHPSRGCSPTPPAPQPHVPAHVTALSHPSRTR
ncbi:hypothetical protein SAMN06272775_6010 [Streptomyces sp. 2323.1]|nr:hypothetical protein SAMN06272775_6010 [Streptomyces sp. 2323.1]